MAHSELLLKIAKLHYWEDNWDGRCSKKPKPEAIKNAIFFFEFYPAHYESFSVSADESGNVVVEFWDNATDTKMTFYIFEKEIEMTLIKSYVRQRGSKHFRFFKIVEDFGEE